MSETTRGRSRHPNSTISILCELLKQQVMQQPALQHLDMPRCCGFVEGIQFSRTTCKFRNLCRFVCLK